MVCEKDVSEVEQFHDPSSSYFGLTLLEQKALSILRRGARKTPRKVSSTWKKATIHDHSELLVHCVNALVQQSSADVECRLDRIKVRMLLLFNYRSHFGKEFPRVVFLAYYDWATLVECNVDTIIDYLHKIGRCAFTARELRRELWAINKTLDRWEFLEDWSIPLCQAEYFSEVFVAASQIKDKAKKGRRHYRKTGKHSIKKSEEIPQQALDNLAEDVVECASQNVGTET